MAKSKTSKSSPTSTRLMKLRLLRKLGIAALVAGIVVWAGAWLWMGGFVQKTYNLAQNSLITWSAERGLQVQSIQIQGRENANLAAIKALLNTRQGDALLGFDPHTARRQLEKIDWIREARVERRLPGTIRIVVEEYHPLARWQEGDSGTPAALIARDGTVIRRPVPSRFRDLVLIHGPREAAARAHEILALIEAEPVLNRHLREAALIGGRRWDLILEGGIRLQLPENDPGAALKRLAEAQKSHAILDKEILRIDARQPDRFIVLPRRGRAGSALEKNVPETSRQPG